MTPDDDFERFMEMSDEEIDRETATALRALDETWNRMTRDQQLRWRRMKAVNACLRWRRLMLEFDLDFMRDNLRSRQRELVKIRHERATGIAPGSA